MINNKKYLLDTQKIIKKRGTSTIILISPEDLELSGLKVGDIVSVKLELVQ